MIENMNDRSEPEVQEADGNVNLISAVAYLGILFFVPLVVHPKNEFAAFHANQGLLLLIAGAAVGFLSSIPIIGWFIIGPLGGLFVFILFIIGVINAFKGRMNRLPLIGQFDLLGQQEERGGKDETVGNSGVGE